MAKINSGIKKQRSFTKIVIICVIAIFCFSIILAISFGQPEIILFSFFFIFLFAFIAIAVRMLVERVKFLKSTNAYSERILNYTENELQTPNQHFYNNPRNFHIFLIVLILANLILSYFNIGTYNESFYDRFYEDLAFQFNIAILFTIIGFLNPLLPIPETLRNSFKEASEKLYGFISNDKKLFYARLIACVLVISLFVYNGWLVFPNFLQENILLMGIDLALLFFVITTTYRMIKYAKVFLVENVFRVIKSFTIATSALFVIVPLAPLTMLSVHLLGMDERTFNFQPIPFIGFNLIMVYVEHTLNVKKKTVQEVTE